MVCVGVAASQGHAVAQTSLARLLKYGDGVTQDKQKAFELYCTAAKQGLAKAQYHIGWMYHKGSDGVPRDAEKAARWFLLAVSQGHEGSLYHLTEMLTNGASRAPSVCSHAAPARSSRRESTPRVPVGSVAWSPKYHRFYPYHTKSAVAVILALSLVDCDSLEPCFPTTPLHRLPLEIMFHIFVMLAADNKTPPRSMASTLSRSSAATDEADRKRRPSCLLS